MRDLNYLLRLFLAGLLLRLLLGLLLLLLLRFLSFGLLDLLRERDLELLAFFGLLDLSLDLSLSLSLSLERDLLLFFLSLLSLLLDLERDLLLLLLLLGLKNSVLFYLIITYNHVHEDFFCVFFCNLLQNVLVLRIRNI